MWNDEAKAMPRQEETLRIEADIINPDFPFAFFFFNHVIAVKR